MRWALGLALATVARAEGHGPRGLLQTTNELWGQLAEADGLPYDMSQIMTCYYGLGMKTCEYNETASAAATGADGSVDMSGVFPDFSWDSVFEKDKVYCLECCSNRRLSYAMDETISLRCDMTNDRATIDGRTRDPQVLTEKDWEFRFARRATTTDDVITVCPLQRGEPRGLLIGYKLTLWVEEHNEIIGFWRGVTQCTAVAIETTDEAVFAEDVFTEEIRLIVGAGTRAQGGASCFVALVAALALQRASAAPETFQVFS